MHSATAELESVDRVPAQERRQQRADDGRQHQGQDDRVVSCHFEQDEDGGNRCVGGAAEERRHTDEGVGTRRPGDRGEESVCQIAEGRSEHGAHEQRGGENASGSTGTQREPGGQHLQQQQSRCDLESQPAEHGVRDGVVADAEDTGEAVHLEAQDADCAEQKPADGGPDPLGAAQALPEVFHDVKAPAESDREEGGEDSQDGVEQQLPGAAQCVLGDVESPHLVCERLRDDVGDHRRDDHRAEVEGVEPSQNHFDGEDGARDRSVEGGRDTPGSAAGH